MDSSAGLVSSPLQLEESPVAGEPEHVVPELAGRLTLGHRIDDRPEHARTAAVIQHQRRHPERAVARSVLVVLGQHFVEGGRIGQRLSLQARIQTRCLQRRLADARNR